MIGALLGWRAVVISLFGGAVIGSVIGVAMLLVARRGAPEGPEAEEGEEGEEEDDGALRHAELPFGPFLAAAAVGYVLAEPWLVAKFFGF